MLVKHREKGILIHNRWESELTLLLGEQYKSDFEKIKQNNNLKRTRTWFNYTAGGCLAEGNEAHR